MSKTSDTLLQRQGIASYYDARAKRKASQLFTVLSARPAAHVTSARLAIALGSCSSRFRVHPRACVRADEIAGEADFFSFGTNDLTQMALGLSRDDAEGKFLACCLEDGVLERNPFEVLDQDGVGELMRLGIERGRATKPKLKIGICGEHGGEPQSIDFCHRLGLDYVSCSPFRVPVARLAAAQATLAEAGSARYIAAGG